LPTPITYSIRLVAALRKDLNRILLDPQFSREFSTLAQTKKHSVKIPNLIVSNRAILEEAFGSDWIEPLATDEEYRLMPVINTTLNLVGGDNRACQHTTDEPLALKP